MKICRRALARIWLASLALPVALLVPGARADDARPVRKDLPAVLDKPAPESIDDLKAIQKQVRTVLEKVIPCTVNVRSGGGQGSGVIISEDGYVLTAGHVSGAADRDVILVFHDGRRVKAKTLGANRSIDSGLIKITEPGKWPFVEMGKSADLKKGQWCIATGHPGGYKAGRTPPVRLGRVLTVTDKLIRTDCTLVGGDSGGPLFDLEGRVIGIHSRIGGTLETNIHVPVDTYRETWDRLTKGEVWGGMFASRSGPYMGFQADPNSKDCKVSEVENGSPAEKGGLKANDVITKFDGKTIDSFETLRELLGMKKPGDEVAVEVRRGDETVKLKITLGRRR